MKLGSRLELSMETSWAVPEADSSPSLENCLTLPVSDGRGPPTFWAENVGGPYRCFSDRQIAGTGAKNVSPSFFGQSERPLWTIGNARGTVSPVSFTRSFEKKKHELGRRNLVRPLVSLHPEAERANGQTAGFWSLFPFGWSERAANPKMGCPDGNMDDLTGPIPGGLISTHTHILIEQCVSFLCVPGG